MCPTLIHTLTTGVSSVAACQVIINKVREVIPQIAEGGLAFSKGHKAITAVIVAIIRPNCFS